MNDVSCVYWARSRGCFFLRCGRVYRERRWWWSHSLCPFRQTVGRVVHRAPPLEPRLWGTSKNPKAPEIRKPTSVIISRLCFGPPSRFWLILYRPSLYVTTTSSLLRWLLSKLHRASVELSWRLRLVTVECLLLPLIKTLELFVRTDVIAVIWTVIGGFGVVYWKPRDGVCEMIFSSFYDPRIRKRSQRDLRNSLVFVFIALSVPDFPSGLRK